VIIEKLPGAQVNSLDKRKFLIPSDISISQLVWIIRKRVHLESEKALFLFVGKTIPSSRFAASFYCCREARSSVSVRVIFCMCLGQQDYVKVVSFWFVWAWRK